MSDFAIISSTTGEWLKGPFSGNTVLIAGANETIISVNSQFGNSMEWSAATADFIATTEQQSPMEKLTSYLVANGVLSDVQVQAILDAPSDVTG